MASGFPSYYSPRIKQSIPNSPGAIKCSDCGRLVSLVALTDHICNNTTTPLVTNKKSPPRRIELPAKPFAHEKPSTPSPTLTHSTTSSSISASPDRDLRSLSPLPTSGSTTPHSPSANSRLPFFEKYSKVFASPKLPSSPTLPPHHVLATIPKSTSASSGSSLGRGLLVHSAHTTPATSPDHSDDETPSSFTKAVPVPIRGTKSSNGTAHTPTRNRSGTQSTLASTGSGIGRAMMFGSSSPSPPTSTSISVGRGAPIHVYDREAERKAWEREERDRRRAVAEGGGVGVGTGKFQKSPTKDRLDDLINSFGGSEEEEDEEAEDRTTPPIVGTSKCASRTIDDYYFDDDNAVTTSVEPEKCRICRVRPSTIEGSALCTSCYRSRYLPKCRKCKKAIEGKAIGSGDGKVKGKFHAGCFNCFSCSAPFPNKEFYVFDERPYCSRHYHKLAGSLCANCDRGIEGPCVSLHDGGRKYHPGCFTCAHPTCTVLLPDHHYLLGGLPYCERHAELPQMSSPRKGGGSVRRAEKRRTIVAPLKRR